jgi:UDP-glucose-4-epimerase GalE
MSSSRDAKTVLVTGGAGYVGSHACKALAAAGYRPVTYDNLGRGHRELVRWGPLEEGDLLDAARLDAVLEQYRPGSVMHFAAFAYVGESVADPALYYRNNVQGSLTLLDAMRRHGIDRFVFSSTCAVYGVPERVPITEDEKRRPINPYGSSKLMVETMLEEFHRAYGMRYVALRYFNAAGADPDGEIGEWHEPETHLIPLVLDAAAGRRPHVEIYGEDYDTPDGTCIRDYIHVSDLATAHVLALGYLDAGGEPGAFNLGNAAGTSVREVIAIASEVTGRRVPVRTAPRRPGDPPKLVADSSRITKALGWQPKHSDIRGIISTAWAWHCRHHGAGT